MKYSNLDKNRIKKNAANAPLIDAKRHKYQLIEETQNIPVIPETEKKQPIKGKLKEKAEEKPKKRKTVPSLKKKKRTSNISKNYFKEEEQFYNEDAFLEPEEDFHFEDYDLNDGLSGTGRSVADTLYLPKTTESHLEHSKVRKRHSFRKKHS